MIRDHDIIYDLRFASAKVQQKIQNAKLKVKNYAKPLKKWRIPIKTKKDVSRHPNLFT
jgi:hypothetical protein